MKGVAQKPLNKSTKNKSFMSKSTTARNKVKNKVKVKQPGRKSRQMNVQ